MGTPGPTKHGIRNLHGVTAIKAIAIEEAGNKILYGTWTRNRLS